MEVYFFYPFTTVTRASVLLIRKLFLINRLFSDPILSFMCIRKMACSLMRVSYLEMKGGVSLLERGQEIIREDLTVHGRHQAHPVILPNI